MDRAAANLASRAKPIGCSPSVQKIPRPYNLAPTAGVLGALRDLWIKHLPEARVPRPRLAGGLHWPTAFVWSGVERPARSPHSGGGKIRTCSATPARTRARRRMQPGIHEDSPERDPHYFGEHGPRGIMHRSRLSWWCDSRARQPSRARQLVQQSQPQGRDSAPRRGMVSPARARALPGRARALPEPGLA